jgi:Beta-propeller repeat
MKIDGLGKLIYATYLAPTNGLSRAQGIAASPSGEAYVTGEADPNFPTTSSAYQASSGRSAFLTKLDPTGTALLYSTCIGSDGGFAYGAQPYGIAIDNAGKAYITGASGSSAIPVTPNAYQGLNHAAAKGTFNPYLLVVDTLLSGPQSLTYASYLGGSDTDIGYGIAVDTSGKVYITGSARSTDFPTTPGAFQNTNTGGRAFVAKFDPTLSGSQSLIYSTDLGGKTGNGDLGYGIAVDSSGAAYVAGETGASDFPTTAGALQPQVFQTCNDAAFVVKINPQGSGLVYSTYLGPSLGGTGSCTTYATSVAIDANGNAFVAGATFSNAFPVTGDALQTSIGVGGSVGGDGFLSVINSTGTSLLYSTYLGGDGDDVANGVAVDVNGDAYVVGATTSIDFPTTSGALQPLPSGGNGCGFLGSGGPCPDAFITKIAFGTSGQLTITGLTQSVGGNTGQVTTTIIGNGFQQGTMVALACPNQANVAGSNLSVDSTGQLISVTFNLVGLSASGCNVVVTNPNGTRATQANGFTIQAGGVADVWVDIVGRNVLRAGVAQQYYLVVGNKGIIDSPTGTTATMTFPAYITYAAPEGQFVGVLFQTGTTSVVLYQFSSQIPAGGTVVVPLTLKAPNDPQYAHQSFQIEAW